MIYIVATVVVLAILIFVHEFGHFLAAKMCNIYVWEFSIGFGPKIFSFKKNETEYKISLIPFGGYVKLLGEDDEDKEITEDIEKYSFANKSTFQKIFVVISGPLSNFIFAVFIFTLITLKGIYIIEPYVGEVQKGMPAYSAGIKKGDKIIEINGKKIEKWSDISNIIKSSNGDYVTIKILRNNKILTFKLKPVKKSYKNIFGETKYRYFIGIVADTTKIKLIHLSIFEALKQGFLETYKWIKLTYLSIVKLIEKVIPFSSLGGPILIGKLAGEEAKHGLFNFLYFLGVISVNLGVLNLVPFPVLDGGRILLILIEKVRGKEFEEKHMELIQKIGFSILIVIMALVFYNDLMRLFKK